MNIIKLNEAMKGRLDEPNMRLLCTYVSVNNDYCADCSYDDLLGNGPGNKSLSLIDYCRRRRALTTLVEGLNQIRPDVLGSDYEAWHSWAADADAK